MCTGSAPNARAMVGSAVAITVESRFCMNSAQATITAVSRVWRLVPRLIRAGFAVASVPRSPVLGWSPAAGTWVGLAGPPLRQQHRAAGGLARFQRDVRGGGVAQLEGLVHLDLHRALLHHVEQ